MLDKSPSSWERDKGRQVNRNADLHTDDVIERKWEASKRGTKR